MGLGSPRLTRWPLLLSLSVSLLQGCDSALDSAGRGGDLAFCMGPLLGLRGEGGGVEGCAPRRRGCCVPMMLAGPLGKVSRGLCNSNGERIEEAANHAAAGHCHRPVWPSHRLNRRISVGTRAGSDPEGADPEKEEAKGRKRARSSRRSGEFMGVKTGWFFRLWRQYKVYRRRKVRQLMGWDGSGPRRQADRSTLIYTTSPTDGSTVLVPGDYMYRYEDDLGTKAARVERRRNDHWMSNLMGMFRSRVFRRIIPHVRFNVIACCIVAMAYLAFPNTAYLSGHMHVITGGFLGLLIAFRTNAGYQRYWEARIIWNEVFNRCRNLSRLMCTYCADPAIVDRALSLLRAYPFTLKQHLRGQRNLEEVSGILSNTDLLAVAVSSNMPTSLCHQMSILIGPSFRVQDQEFVGVWAQMEFDIQALVNCVGASERIAGTPVPLSYSRHTSRFISIWTLTLPFHMVGFFHPLVLIPTYAFVCWALMGTEEVGHIIEEPFGAIGKKRKRVKDSTEGMISDVGENLPLLSYCNSIIDEIKVVREEYDNISHFWKDKPYYGNSFGIVPAVEEEKEQGAGVDGGGERQEEAGLGAAQLSPGEPAT